MEFLEESSDWKNYLKNFKIKKGNLRGKILEELEGLRERSWEFWKGLSQLSWILFLCNF